MLKILRSAETWRYTPIADEALPAEQRTSFRLKPMTGPERAVAVDEITRTIIEPDGTQTVVRRLRQVSLALCLSHIEAVENFPAGKAEPWPETEKARLEYLNGFPDDVIEEVGNEIFQHSAVGAPEKNSSPPGPTSA